MTDAQFAAWVASSDALRCVLVEATASVAGVETVHYLSSRHYITGPTDTPASTAYLPLVGGSVSITEQLPVSGGASMGFGDIEIVNAGDLDGWLGYVWSNRPIRVYFGDARWPRADFRLVFDGTIDDLGSRARNTLNLKARDKLQRLNTPMTSNKLGGSTANKERLRPLCFGECHNIEPLLIDPATLTYQIHDGPIERIIEVRDNGVPVAYTATLSAGTFRLSANPAGVITCSAQGSKAGGTYRNTIAALVQHIVTSYGKAADRFTAGDLDTANFGAFATANPQPVGLYLADRTNVLDACAQLAGSVGAQLVMSRQGLLRLLRIALPAPGTSTAAGPEQMELHTLRIASRPPVQAAVQIAYCRNYTPQTGLQTGIPEAHKKLFAEEWLTASASDGAVATAYRLDVEPEPVQTALLVETDAQAEAARRLALWKQQRTGFAYTGLPELLTAELGSAQTLTNPRFGLAAGQPGQIVALATDWMRGRVNVEVLN